MNQDALTILQQQLASARMQLKHSAIRTACVRSIEPALWIACAAAVCFLVLRMSGGINLSGGVFLTIAVGCSLLLGAVLSALLYVLPACLALPDLEAAAQRLDLATTNDNRIATAIDFSKKTTATSLELAAIADGIRSVEILKTHLPSLENALLPWRRLWTPLLVLSLISTSTWLLFGATDLISGPPIIGEEPTKAQLAPIQMTDTLEHESALDTTQASRPTASRRDRATGHGDTPTTHDQRTTQRPSDGLAESGNTLASAMGANAGSGSSVTAGSPTTRRRQPTQHPKSARPGRRPQQQADVAAKQQPTPSAGGSAGTTTSASRSAMNDAATLHASEPSDDEASPNEDEEDEEERASKQRGGVQPIAKDRNAAPSRDLGLGSSLKGKPGTGRGGPTPAKKSRGTASLVLGVPVPDHVRGQLRSGKDKIVRGRTTPLDDPGRTTGVTPVAPRNSDESFVRRFELPPDVYHTLSTFFVTWHASDGRINMSPSGSDPHVVTEIDHE